jgi:plastocyanin
VTFPGIQLGAAAIVIAAAAMPAFAATIPVVISDLAFAPDTLVVHVGDTIEWVNHDFVAHTATAMNGDWDVEVEPGATASMKVAKLGVIRYFCQFHPGMIGTVSVLP